MSTYHAPLADMQFVLNELAGLDQVGKLPGFEDATPETVTAILDEASKFATNVLDPLNWSGDREGAQWLDDGKVKTPAGFKEAYGQFCAKRLERTHQESRVRRPGPAAARRDRGRGDVARGESRVRPVPDAHAGRDRGARAARQRRR